MTKRPLGHGDIRNMSNFKAVQMDYEYYLTLGDEGRLYCLTDRQVYVLMVQLTYVGWLTRWYNTDDITQTTVGYVQSELMEALMSCVDVSILVDQGKLSLTRDVQNQQIQSQILRQNYADEYDGSPTSINPNAPTDNFGADGERYDALCAALMGFVYQFAKSQAEAVIAADITAFALLSGVALLLIPGLNVFYIAGAALALIVGGGIVGVTTAVAAAALCDTTALDQVVCFMRDTLKDQDVTDANWSSCLDTYPFTPGSNASIVADFIKPTLADNYLPVLDMLGQAYSGTINGEPLPECPCVPVGPFCHTINLEDGYADIVLNYTEGGFPYATQWTSGIGIEGARPGFLDECIVKLVLPAPARITSLTFTTGSVSDASNAYLFCWPNGDNAFTPQTATTGINEPVFTFDEDCDFIQFGVDRAGLDRTPIAPLTSVTINGTGVNPWGSSNC